MTTFRYDGTDANGDQQSGQIEAPSADAAKRELEARGIIATRIEDSPASDDQTPKEVKALSSSESEVVSNQVRDLIAGGLPLAEGLRAAAGEYNDSGLFSVITSLLPGRNSQRIRRALLAIAAQLESGKSIEECLSRRSRPEEIKAVLQSGISSQAAALAIGEYSGYAEISTRLRRQTLFLFAYPFISVAAAAVIMGLFFTKLVPTIKSVLLDFDTELPAMTQVLLEISDIMVSLGSTFVLGLPIVFVIMLIVLLTLFGSWASSILRQLPIIGTGFRYLDLARVGHLLAVVLRHNATVPGALRAAGLGSNSRKIRAACEQLAASVDAGKKLPTWEPALRGLPLSFLHVAKDDSDRDTIADALHSLSRMLEQRGRSIMTILAGITQPLLVMLVCFGIALSFYALFLPFLNVMNNLM